MKPNIIVLLEPQEKSLIRKLGDLKKFRYKDTTKFGRPNDILGHRFHDDIHVAFYNKVILDKANEPVIKQRYIDWDGCRKMKDPELDKALGILEAHNL